MGKNNLRIATWNTRGDAFAREDLITCLSDYQSQQMLPDVICLQETGDLARFCGTPCDLESRLYYGKWLFNHASYWIIFYPWGTGNLRCSMAVMVKHEASIGPSKQVSEICPIASLIELSLDKSSDEEEEKQVEAIDPTEEDLGEKDIDGFNSKLREVMMVDIGHIIIYNVHLPSGHPKYARALLYDFILNSGAEYQRSIIIGDFNNDVSAWNLSGLRQFQISVPKEVTYPLSNKKYDYIMTNCPSIVIDNNVYHDGGSDHRMVLYNIRIP